MNRALAVLVLFGLMAGSGRIESQQRASLAGDSFLMTVGGEVRPNAGGEVRLVPVGKAVYEAMAALCAKQRRDHEAQSRADSVQRSEQIPDDHKRVQEVLELQSTLFVARAQERFEERVALVGNRATERTRASITGGYRFPSVRPGDYWVFSSMQVGDDTAYWLVRKRLSPGANLLDLAHYNQYSASCDDPLP